jgi:OPA family sugar phosphate sensor protein UhpC-like MFS transporter
VNKFFKFLEPAPAIPEMDDPEKIAADYQGWRIRILYSSIVGYALYYFSRRSLIFAMPGLIADLGYDKSQLGLLGSVLAISYGISKFFSGILSDKSSPRYFMAMGLFLTGIVNIFFGLSSSLIVFTVLWGFNGWFQGFGWPPCTRFLTQWYSQSERGAWWSTMNLAHNIGSFTIAYFIYFCMQYAGWRCAMIMPGVVCILGSFFLINRLRDTPQSIGLPAIEKFRNDYGNATAKEIASEEKPMTTREILKEYIFRNKVIWLLSAAYFCVYIVRSGVGEWTSLFLQEAKGYSQLGGNSCVSVFEIGGFLGSLAAGWASDYFFRARRGPVNLLFAFGMCASVGLFWCVPPGYPILDTAAVFLTGFMIFGPQMLIGIAAAESVPKRAAATANGFVGCASYFGSAIAGYPLGAVTDKFGWEAYFMFLITACVFSVVFLLPLFSFDKKRAPVGVPEQVKG